MFLRFRTCHHGGTKILLILGSATIQLQDTEPSAAVPPGLGGVGVAPAQWPPSTSSLQLCIPVTRPTTKIHDSTLRFKSWQVDKNSL